MYILGIESSAVSAGAAVVKDGKIISESYINAGLTHSQTLMKLTDNALENAGIKISDLGSIAVSAGPGSFTGIRIGVAAAKGLAFANDTPCYGISTLEAMANAADAEGCIICPVMDARCSQVYNALFEKKDGQIIRLTPDRPLKLEELAAEIQTAEKKILLTGDGADITYAYLTEKGIKCSVFSEIYKFQRASGVAITAYRLYNRGESPVSADNLTPDYLRLSQAERELKKKQEGNSK